jgi:NAD-dependent dihydropyrimidine dehydrogenase PreA subunit
MRIDEKICTACGQCVDMCMKEAIKLNIEAIKKGDKKAYVIDEAQCAECGVCLDCPSGAVTDE